MGKDNTELAFPDYWNKRYIEEEGKEDTYEWFRDWQQIGRHIHGII